MSVPSFVIVIPFEGPVEVYMDAATDLQAARLDRWVREHPELDDLLTRACSLADRTENAA